MATIMLNFGMSFLLFSLFFLTNSYLKLQLHFLLNIYSVYRWRLCMFFLLNRKSTIINPIKNCEENKTHYTELN